MGQEDKEYTWNLVARKLAGEASPAELKELERLLRGNPELHYPLQTIADLWQNSGQGEQKMAEQAFSRHLDRMESLHVDFDIRQMPADPDYSTGEDTSRPFIIRHSSRFILAAALLFTVILGLVLYRVLSDSRPFSTPASPGISEVATHNGSRTNLSLPDGTKVWLNAGSRITYDKSFGITSREINLTGEAFFDIAHNPGKPFVIHAARVDIKVLGTRFNLKSYPLDKTTEATLIRGSIEVSIKARPNEKIILKPNEKLIVVNDDSALHRMHTSPAAPPEPSLVTIRQPTYEAATGTIVETSWVDDKLIFQDETFGALAKEMERWYGVNIQFTSPEQEEWRFTGNFQKESIRQALDALELTARFTYIINENQITIYNR